MLGHFELRAYTQAFAGNDSHVEPGRVRLTATKALRVVANELFPRRWRLRVSHRKRGVGRRCGRKSREHRGNVNCHDARLVLRGFGASDVCRTMPCQASHMSNPSIAGEGPAAGSSSNYRERLRAPLWLWIVCAGLVAIISYAYAFALGNLAGIALAVALGGIAIWLLIATAPLIEVTDTEFRAGRAHIDWAHVGLVATLDAGSADRARGREADPRAFAVSRSLTTRTAVTLEVLDDDDPHPYWLVSTRNPQELGQAITQAQDAGRKSTPSR